MKPTVTVVIPLYNKASYIERALRSIQAQTYPHWQAIIVDDGSQDDGVDRVRHLRDSRFQLIQQANAGPGAARNRGLHASTAPLVAFLDADDEWLPEFLERGVKTLEAFPDCALWSAGQLRGKERRYWQRNVLKQGRWRVPLKLSGHHLKQCLDSLHLSSGAVARRTVLAELGGFYEKSGCNYGEDLYLLLQVVLAYPIYYEPEPLIWYHTEASAFGMWKRQALPPVPIAIDPAPIRSRCPATYQSLLERCLNYYAVLSARRLIAADDIAQARQLLRDYPQAWDVGLPYAKARWELASASSSTLQQFTHFLKVALRRFRAF